MVDETTGGNGNGADPYHFDPGQSFFDVGGLEGTGEGNDGKIPILDPSAGTDENGGTENASGNPGSSSSTGNTATGTVRTGKRGRPKGSRNGTRQEKTVYLENGWNDLLIMGHFTLAKLAECPELEIEEAEAKKIIGACDKVLAHYQIQPSESQKVWAGFFGAFGSVYGPRVWAIYKRKNAEKVGKMPPRVVPISDAFPPKG